MAKFLRELSLRDTSFLVIGSVIGSGIFMTTGYIGESLPSPCPLGSGRGRRPERSAFFWRIDVSELIRGGRGFYQIRRMKSWQIPSWI